MKNALNRQNCGTNKIARLLSIPYNSKLAGLAHQVERMICIIRWRVQVLQPAPLVSAHYLFYKENSRSLALLIKTIFHSTLVNCLVITRIGVRDRLIWVGRRTKVIGEFSCRNRRKRLSHQAYSELLFPEGLPKTGLSDKDRSLHQSASKRNTSATCKMPFIPFCRPSLSEVHCKNVLSANNFIARILWQSKRISDRCKRH